MKVYVDTWIYVTEKFGNMGFIEVYRGILRYETGIYPTIPNFMLNLPYLISIFFSGCSECTQRRICSLFSGEFNDELIAADAADGHIGTGDVHAVGVGVQADAGSVEEVQLRPVQAQVGIVDDGVFHAVPFVGDGVFVVGHRDTGPLVRAVAES